MRFYSKMQTSIAKVGNDETCWANILCYNFLHALQCTQNTPCAEEKAVTFFSPWQAPKLRRRKTMCWSVLNLSVFFVRFSSTDAY